MENSKELPQCVKEVWLFGSCLTYNVSLESDIDVLVIIKEVKLIYQDADSGVIFYIFFHC
ncbi:nucleotidyltransferase domain-containing protein [Clostridium sp. CX1]|uniref:nucleotidyltransferase domain-containing protein n=1 Tax=Clostridium sp. CX1 TaxID=2978346 RepID=UPI0037BEC5B8